jgi:hypothetical protein
MGAAAERPANDAAAPLAINITAAIFIMVALEAQQVVYLANDCRL